MGGRTESIAVPRPRGKGTCDSPRRYHVAYEDIKAVAIPYSDTES